MDRSLDSERERRPCATNRAVSDLPKRKSIGRRASPKGSAGEWVGAPAAKAAMPASGKSARGKAQKDSVAKKVSLELRVGEQALLLALASRTKLSASEVVSRALHSYAAAVAPELRSAPLHEESTVGAERLFVSVDGRPEVEIGTPEFVLGSGEGCDLRLDLPLIAPRHARILVRDGRHLFEDLRSPKGSYRHGALVDVRFLEDGDEIDLGGFLPVRFRVERPA
jgi:hypothetical protein